MRPPLGRVLVIIPTYNEADNVERIVARMRAAQPDVHVLVADDHSPDGTGQLADALAAADDHVHVMHRMAKEGLGAAYLAGLSCGVFAGTDELAALWKAERTFTPTLARDRAAERMADWEHAVRQATLA